MLLHIANGQRHEQDAAYEKAEKCQLERRKSRTGDLQRNFHGPKSKGCQDNTKRTHFR